MWKDDLLLRLIEVQKYYVTAIFLVTSIHILGLIRVTGDLVKSLITIRRLMLVTRTDQFMKRADFPRRFTNKISSVRVNRDTAELLVNKYHTSVLHLTAVDAPQVEC